MAGNYNHVVIAGNIVRDPELKYAGELPILELGMAVNDDQKVKGEWTKVVSFFDIVTFGSRAEFLGKSLKKGSSILVSGRLKQDRWQNKEGQNRSKVRVVADKVVFLDKLERKDGGGYNQAPPQQQYQQQQSQPPQQQYQAPPPQQQAPPPQQAQPQPPMNDPPLYDDSPNVGDLDDGQTPF